MIEHWFALPVSFVIADEATQKMIADQYEDSREQIEALLKEGTWGDNITTTFNTCKNLMKEHRLCILTQMVCEQAEQLLKGECEITESWVNYSDKYAAQGAHIHLHEGISGVYYLQTNGQDGNLKLHAPYQQLDRNFDAVAYTPQVGKLILFPAWVMHSVMVNKTDHRRISISFNVRKL